MTKHRWWILILCLSVLLVFASVILRQASAEKPAVYLTQVSGYDQYMAQGYAATSRRDYRRARGFFLQALQVRPGDVYATAAIRNMDAYLSQKRPLNIVAVGTVRGTKAGARRGESCLEKDKRMIPLVPTPKGSGGSGSETGGRGEAPKTTEARPSFFFYIPVEGDKKPRWFQLTIKDSQGSGKNVVKQVYKPVSKSGVYQVDYPSGGLEVGKEYTWTFSAVCDRNDFSKSIDIEGQVQRTQLNPGLQDLLRNTQGLEKVTWYASSGYLQEALRELSKLTPNNETTSAWRELLQSANITETAAINAFPPAKLQPR